MKKILYTIVLGATLTASCTTVKKDTTMNTQITTPEKTIENPFFVESTLPYGTPDFTKINNSHFRSALMQGMQEQKEKIMHIATQRSLPTFENTILPLESSGKLLSRVSSVFYGMAGAHTNDEIKALQKEMSPILSKHRDEIALNSSLFYRIKTIYDMRKSLNLDPESIKLIEEYYTDYVIAGAELSENDKATMSKINARLAALSTEFNQKLLEATNTSIIKITDESELEGLTDAQKKAIQNEDGTWSIKIINTTQQPLLTYLSNRALRKKLYDASVYRTDSGDLDTRSIVLEIARLRAKKAELSGFNDYASWNLQQSMAKTPAAVMDLLKGLIPAASAKAKEEAAEIQGLMKEMGVTHDLKPWDWNYYAELLRKKKYDLDEAAIKPYFELTNVLEKGVFYAANKLFGITYKKRTDLPVYQDDVVAYELFEEDGSKLGLFYGDFFSRDSKRGGAWMSSFVKQSKLFKQKPVVYNVCNNPKPPKGQPALLTYDQVETMFHEFGHALHGLFADQQYASLSGTSVARDFVEYPSQLYEYCALYPEILSNYALHYKTGEPMPQELVDKIKKAATFNQGYRLSEALSAATMDMVWHMKSSKDMPEDVAKYEYETLKNLGFVPDIVPPRYHSTYFAHVFGGGYGAGYYSYLWTELLMHDSYIWFQENGGFTRENGQRFRDMILSRGNTMDYKKMYHDFAGEINVDAMLKAKGLK